MNIPTDKLGVLIKMIHFTYESKINEVLKMYDLTRSQCDILMYLSRSEENVTQRMIEKTFHISNPTVTGLLNRLENKGFIERKSLSKDARYRYIVLTDKAIKVENKLKEELDKNEEELFSFLNNEEREMLRILLKKIIIHE